MRVIKIQKNCQQ
uniref:Truncated envelope glycoprotein n=1 Tax=Human immunodeficiency virus type 1 TaxID=11676 RepID=A0A0H3YC82_HV1|nr:truncated envelope glycoprotein [Human immunodeficiency virus 1]